MKKIGLFFRKERTGFLIFINVFWASVFNIIDKRTKSLLHIDKAIDYYNSIKDSLRPKETFEDSLYSMKADILERMEKFDEALTFINKAIKINPMQADLYETRADILYSLKDFNSAIEDYSKVLNKAKRKSDIYTKRGGAKFKIKDYQGSIEDLTNAIKLGNNNYLIYFERGKVQTWLENHDESIADYSSAIKINPKVPEIYFERAIVYYNLDKKSLALNDIKIALNLIKKSNSLSDFFNYCKSIDIAYILFEKDKQMALNFLIDIEKNCTANKDLVYTTLSYMFYDMENYKKALKYANLAILKNSQNGTAYYRKKCALEKLGRKEEAKECYDRALKLGYKE